VILGIDPGTRILGFGVVRILERKVSYVDMGIVDLRKEDDHFVKLQKITKEITAIIEKYMPDEMAVEAPFYGKNPQTMLKLGRAQGAAIAAALLKDIPIFEYAPRSVKLAITGTGAASKEQVALMVQKHLGISCPQKFADATDALSIALCHAYDRTSIGGVSAKKNTTWESFVKNNPEKVKK
jgi:crossover junction endodeoxyribonuclease RuvC